MKHLTKEEVLQEIAAGNWTIKGLGAKFGLTRDGMKSALATLGISDKDRQPKPTIMNSYNGNKI